MAIAPTKAAWMPAHIQGCSTAPAWLKTDSASSTPTMPWCSTT
jgi:hypothetical protein